MTRPKRRHRARRRTLIPRIFGLLGGLDQRVVVLEDTPPVSLAHTSRMDGVDIRLAAIEHQAGLFAEALKSYLPR
jgi:hypothetical protein